MLYAHRIRRLVMIACTFVTFCWVAGGFSAVFANKPQCYAGDIKRAVNALRYVANWDGFYDSYKRFGRCDRGQVAEEYSYALGRLLAHEWKRVDLLLQFASSDVDFKQFVLKHIDENVPEEESQVIIRNAREQCPPDGEWLCKAIVDY